MEKLIRYEPEYSGMEPYEDGGWVKYEVFEKVENKLKEAEERIVVLEKAEFKLQKAEDRIKLIEPELGRALQNLVSLGNWKKEAWDKISDYESRVEELEEAVAAKSKTLDTILRLIENS